MPSLITPHGLEKVYLGTGVTDFAADDIIDVTTKSNINVDILEEGLATLDVLEVDMTKLRDAGFTAGFINGGLCPAA